MAQASRRSTFHPLLALCACALLTHCLSSSDDDTCATGSEGCECYENATCDDGLSCRSEHCVDAESAGSSDADASAPGTDGDPQEPVTDGEEPAESDTDAPTREEESDGDEESDGEEDPETQGSDPLTTDESEEQTEQAAETETESEEESDVTEEPSDPDDPPEQTEDVSEDAGTTSTDPADASTTPEEEPTTIYASCNALHTAEPDLPSGEYTIEPVAAEPFLTYCDMTTDGGGWTLAFNQDPSFDPTAMGDVTHSCYLENCTNFAYATVPVEMDVMFQAADEDILVDNWLAQIIVRGVHEDSRGRTLKGLMDAPGHFFLEAEDNSNLELTTNAGGDPCDVLERGFRTMACDTPVFAFADVNDNTACTEQESVGHKFALGGETSYSEHWYNCAGWPQHPVNQGVSEMPLNFRFFVR